MTVDAWLPLLIMLALVAVGLMIPAGRRGLATLLLGMRGLYVEAPLRLLTRRPHVNYPRIRELEVELGYREPALGLGAGTSTGLGATIAGAYGKSEFRGEAVWDARLPSIYSGLAPPAWASRTSFRGLCDYWIDADADDACVPGVWKALQSAEEAAALAEREREAAE